MLLASNRLWSITQFFDRRFFDTEQVASAQNEAWVTDMEESTKINWHLPEFNFRPAKINYDLLRMYHWQRTFRLRNIRIEKKCIWFTRANYSSVSIGGTISNTFRTVSFRTVSFRTVLKMIETENHLLVKRKDIGKQVEGGKEPTRV